METDERPIEALIGWTWNQNYRFWVTSPYASDSRQRAEVDDLADWLTNRVDSIEINGPWTVVSTGETYWEAVKHEGEQISTGPTIREALIAAVRLVVGEDV